MRIGVVLALACQRGGLVLLSADEVSSSTGSRKTPSALSSPLEPA